MTVTSVLLDVLTWLSLGVVGLLALAQLRDILLQYGFISRNGVVGRQAARGQASQVVAGLEALGLDDQVAGQIRSFLSPPKLALRRLAKRERMGEDVRFLTMAQPSVYRLDEPYNYKGAQYYLDIMGAIAGNRNGAESLDQVFAQWITRASAATGADWVDAFLAPKDGNVALCQAVAARFGKPLILCKGGGDKALVDRARPNEPHETDFEGLKAFIEAAEGKAKLHGHRFSFWVIDDSCSGGSQIASLVGRFRRWVELNGPSLGWDVMPVDRCFVLFRATARGVTDSILVNAGVRLDALVSLGEDELRLLRRLPPGRISGEMAEFKKDAFSCATSVATLGVGGAYPDDYPPGVRIGRAIGYQAMDLLPRSLAVAESKPLGKEIVLVVDRVSLCRKDIEQLGNRALRGSATRFPAILGASYAGIVVEVGSAVTEFRAGDRVLGLARPLTPHGALRNYLSVREDGAIAAAPSHLSLGQAAALVEPGLRALSALRSLTLAGGSIVGVLAHDSNLRRCLTALLEVDGCTVVELSMAGVDAGGSFPVDQGVDLVLRTDRGAVESSVVLAEQNSRRCTGDWQTIPGTSRSYDPSECGSGDLPSRLTELSGKIELSQQKFVIGRELAAGLAVDLLTSGSSLGDNDVLLP